jgi:hypothetical protein
MLTDNVIVWLGRQPHLGTVLHCCWNAKQLHGPVHILPQQPQLWQPCFVYAVLSFHGSQLDIAVAFLKSEAQELPGLSACALRLVPA